MANIIKIVFGILVACCEILVAATFFYYYDQANKGADGDYKIDFGNKVNKDEEYSVNRYWVYHFYPVFLGLISLLFAVYEILLIVPQLSSYSDLFNAPIFRAIFYLFMAIPVIGLAGNLGISAGTFGLLAGVLTIISAFL